MFLIGNFECSLLIITLKFNYFLFESALLKLSPARWELLIYIFNFCSHKYWSGQIHAELSTSQQLLKFYYRPPTKLEEGNVFNRVRPSAILSREGGVPCDHYHGTLDLTTQGPLGPLCPPSCTGTPWPWPRPDMFKLVQLRPHCTGIPLDMFKLVHYEAHMVGKWVVGILLECFLLTMYWQASKKNLPMGTAV